MNGNRLGELLMDADVITKRQLAKAIQRQVAGDTRRIGEILVEMGERALKIESSWHFKCLIQVSAITRPSRA